MNHLDAEGPPKGTSAFPPCPELMDDLHRGIVLAIADLSSRSSPETPPASAKFILVHLREASKIKISLKTLYRHLKALEAGDYIGKIHRGRSIREGKHPKIRHSYEVRQRTIDYLAGELAWAEKALEGLPWPEED